MSPLLIKKNLPGARIWATVTVLLAGAGLFVLGAQPVAVGLFSPPWDKLAHLATFAVIGMASGIASGAKGVVKAVCCVAGALVLGIADELHQMYLPGRSASWPDLIADALGGLLGAILLHVVPVLMQRKLRHR